jgi:hypothetical protein
MLRNSHSSKNLYSKSKDNIISIFSNNRNINNNAYNLFATTTTTTNANLNGNSYKSVMKISPSKRLSYENNLRNEE